MPTKNTENRIKRPPIVVVMGHIDHGKSTLLDYIRKTNIVAKEAGGITQHVGAYEAEHTGSDGLKNFITFLDTPGHEAFGSIRERGAKIADIAILVVSAEDGVKPQTLEALRAIKNEKIPFIVAINKIDKPNANVEKTKQSLGENEVYLEGWGGDVPNVAISALKGTGVPELLDMILLVAELADLKTDPTKKAEGMVIESELDSRKGISATLLIKDGTMKIGDFVVAGKAFAPVRFIENFLGKKLDQAGASRPARIIGWSDMPNAGQNFVTAENKKAAERLAAENRQIEQELAKSVKAPPKPVHSTDGEKKEEIEIVTLPLIIKADVIGSLEGIKYEFKKLNHDKVRIKIVSEGIGYISENDVKTALGDPEVLIIGFNAEPDKKAASLIERSPVKVHNFSIIYELSEFVKNALLLKVPKEYIEESTGCAKIMAVFSKEKDRQVVGGKVETGNISSGNDVKIMRRNAEIGRGKIRELQEKKMRTKDVAEGHEFGMMVEAKVEIAPGDKVEAVRTVEKKQ